MDQVFRGWRSLALAAGLICAALLATASPAAAGDLDSCIAECKLNCKMDETECLLTVSQSCRMHPVLGAVCQPLFLRKCQAAGVYCQRVGCETMSECPKPTPTPTPPPPPPPRDKGGASKADPHIYTFDGLAYDFQAAGEFVLARSDDGAFEVQTRQEPISDTRFVAFNTAVALRVGTDRVGLYAGPTPALRINGEIAEPEVGAVIDLPGGGRVERAAAALYRIEWPDGGGAADIRATSSYIDVTLSPPPALAGRLQGLLGDFDGDPANDIRPRGGAPLAGVDGRWSARADIYGAFGESWRVDDAGSLFDYEPGQTTASFARPGYPARYVTLTDLEPDAVDAARAVCEAAGLTETVPLEDCTFDVAATGDRAYAESHTNMGGLTRAAITLPTYLDGWTPVIVTGGTNARWEVSPDDGTALQLADGDPTFLVGPDDLIDVTIRLDIGVDEVVDNDFIGFALGYRGPLKDGGGDADFLLFDWKSETSRYDSDDHAVAGFRLARFYGPIRNAADDFLEMKPGGPATILFERREDGIGWTQRKVHKAEIRYAATRVQIVIDGAVVTDVEGDFAPGRFALYSHSQQRTRFSNIEIAPGIEFGEAR